MKKMLKEKLRSRDFLKFLTIASTIVILYFVVREFIGNVDTITSFAESAGVWGPVVLIVLTSLGILLTPVPSIFLIIAAGYLYGAWEGALYSYIGHLIAAILAFFVFRKMRVNKRESRRFEKYKKLVEENKNLLYLFYAIPILPLSFITLISATSKMRWKQFLKIITISFIPTVIFFSFFGERVNSRNPVEIGIWFLGILILGIIVLEIIKYYKRRAMNGYPSPMKMLKLKRKGKYLKFSYGGKKVGEDEFNNF